MNLTINSYKNYSPNFGSVFVEVSNKKRKIIKLISITGDILNNGQFGNVIYDIPSVVCSNKTSRILEFTGYIKLDLVNKANSVFDNTKDSFLANAIAKKGFKVWTGNK